MDKLDQCSLKKTNCRTFTISWNITKMLKTDQFVHMWLFLKIKCFLAIIATIGFSWPHLFIWLKIFLNYNSILYFLYLISGWHYPRSGELSGIKIFLTKVVLKAVFLLMHLDLLVETRPKKVHWKWQLILWKFKALKSLKSQAKNV